MLMLKPSTFVMATILLTTMDIVSWSDVRDVKLTLLLVLMLMLKPSTFVMATILLTTMDIVSWMDARDVKLTLMLLLMLMLKPSITSMATILPTIEPLIPDTLLANRDARLTYCFMNSIKTLVLQRHLHPYKTRICLFFL